MTAETKFAKELRLSSQSTDASLDSLFLSPDFTTASLIPALSVTNIDGNSDQEAYLHQVERASGRLRKYLDQLRDQIVIIVEKESDGFLQVAQKLDGFKHVLSGLKQSHTEFYNNFTAEKAKTETVYNYILDQNTQLAQLKDEKREIEHLVALQETYDTI